MKMIMAIVGKDDEMENQRTAGGKRLFCDEDRDQRRLSETEACDADDWYGR